MSCQQLSVRLNHVQATCCSHQLWGAERCATAAKWHLADPQALMQRKQVVKEIKVSLFVPVSRLLKRLAESFQRGQRDTAATCLVTSGNQSNQWNQHHGHDRLYGCVSPYPKYAAVGPGKLRRCTRTVNDNHPRSRCPSSILLRLQGRSFRFSWVAV